MPSTPTPEQCSGYADGHTVRVACRDGTLQGHTSGFAPGYVQGNLVVLPAENAGHFAQFCERNPKPCPIIGLSEGGDVTLPGLGIDIDIRTDLPRYRVWEHGELVSEPTDIKRIWRDDLFAFVIGCSFTFEDALIRDGVPLRHLERRQNVAMYRTSIPTRTAGPFSGPLVVSMRPMKAADAIRAIEITSNYPAVHGAPVHLGDPGLIGIHDLSKPDYGDPDEIRDDELPVFWACGVTPQAALANAKLPFAITHAPGCMLVTDRLNTDFANFTNA